MPDDAPAPPPARSDSAIVRMLRSAWRGAAGGWTATPGDARRRFIVRLGVATVVAAAASTGSAVLLRAVATDEGLLPGDARLTGAVEGWLSIHSALWLGAFTSSAMVVPLLVVAALLWARRGRWERATTALAAFVASKAIIMAGWTTWARDRPGGVAGGEVVPAELSSFPSGHTVQTWTAYGLLVLWWAASTGRRAERALAWTLLVAGALVIGVARVRIGAHHPTDVLGASVLGGLWLAGAAWAERAVRGGREGAAAAGDP